MDIYDFEIRSLGRKDWEDAIQLAWDTFLIFEAPDYGKAGIKSFKSFIRDPMLKRMFIMGEYIAYGAFLRDTGDIIGVLGVRGITHVSLLFVQADFHHRGIASAMMYRFFSDAKRKRVRGVTVNSSPFAVGFYHKIGFEDTDHEIVTDGIRYTPMEYLFCYG